MHSLGNCVQYPCNSTAYAKLKWAKEKKSQTVMWKKGNLIAGMRYQDGNLTILSHGLYFINCQLHFLINNCSEMDGDLHTKLYVNNNIAHQVLNTVLSTNTSGCKIYKDQHFSLHIELNASDNVSVQTNFPEFLNEDFLADSFVFEVFKL
ncbi:tumor necrosis factor ligand superfamily member 8 isoform X2 [Hyla sarda]|uniref:tumor necrosis factor ligand superfamily member 8 isoform X2 n=1 Tax=Hyla sarda TaxID=327740 RepID=UPI0024C27033|nr:tumor necrosis factor ligand superfamily member 8 isoform X2 [Hyla sarda]